MKIFSNLAFQSYVCFPYVDCKNTSGKSWVIEVLVVEELFSFPYLFQLPRYFLRLASKNDLRLKVKLMKSLAISDREKRFDLEEFFNPINVRNADLSQLYSLSTFLKSLDFSHLDDGFIGLFGTKC